MPSELTLGTKASMQMFYLHNYLGRLSVVVFFVWSRNVSAGKKKRRKKSNSVQEYVGVPLPHKAFCIEVKAIPLG